MFDYKLLKAYAKVIQEGGFERAAEKIHITQSAISQRVKLLEEQFGQILLLRTTPPSPTPAGKKILKLYNQVKHLEDDFKRSLEPDDAGTFTTLPVGVNADTVDTWFFHAVQPFLKREKVVLDLFVDDQDRTHRFLRDGNVLACISTRETAVQGCRIEYIGDIIYGLYSSPGYADKWFPEGLTINSLTKAPTICFTRDDTLNTKLFGQIFDSFPRSMPTHYIPSAVMFIHLLKNGMGYGVLPEQQSWELLLNNDIIDLAPENKIRVKLYWHCWNLKSRLLQRFTRELLSGFKRMHPGCKNTGSD